MAKYKGTITKGTRIEIKDNSGLKYMSLNSWGKQPFDTTFFVPNKWRHKIKRKKLKGTILNAKIVTLRKGVKRGDGCVIRCKQTQRITINSRKVPGGSRVFTHVPLEATKKVVLISNGTY